MSRDTTTADDDESPVATALASLLPEEGNLASAVALEEAWSHIVVATAALKRRENVEEARRAACLRAIARTVRVFVAHEPAGGPTGELVAPHRARLREVCLTGLAGWRAFAAGEAVETQEQFVATLLALLTDDVDDPEIARHACETLSNISRRQPEMFHAGLQSEPRPASKLIGQLLERIHRATPADEPAELSEQLDVVAHERRAVWLRWTVLTILEATPYDDELVATIEQFRRTQDAPAVTPRAVDDDTQFASLLGAMVALTSVSSDSDDDVDVDTNMLRRMPLAEQFRVGMFGSLVWVPWRLLLGANPALSPAQRRHRQCFSVLDLLSNREKLPTGSLCNLFILRQTTVQATEITDALCDGIHPAHQSQCDLLWRLYEQTDTTFEDRHFESIRSSALEISLPLDGPVTDSWIPLIDVALSDGLSEDRREALLGWFVNPPSVVETDKKTAKILSVLLRGPCFNKDELTTALNRLYDAAGTHPDTAHWLARTLGEPFVLLDSALAPDVHLETLYVHLSEDRLRELYASLRAAFETHLQGFGSPSVRSYDDVRLLAAVYSALPTTEGVVAPDSVLKRVVSVPSERTRLFAETELLK